MSAFNFIRQYPRPVVIFLTTGLALALYIWTLSPGLTWANFGADGGDLISAAVTNGVPHPPGYPLYTLLLQAWLWGLGVIAPASELAWRSNLLSATAAAAAVGITTHLAYTMRAGTTLHKALSAALVGLAWAISPLLWGQAIITEVYALHALLFVMLVWIAWGGMPYATLRRPLLLGFVIGLGLAHHLTIVLLLPALLYWLWSAPDQPLRRRSFWAWGVVGALPGLLLYARILAVASSPAPVHWGYPQTWADLWWLVSGTAYQGYLLGPSQIDLLWPRLSHWALVISSQWTPVGFVVVVAGLYALDEYWPRLRTFSLLWILPVSLYAIMYNTLDSEVYLLPVVWIMALWLPDGLLILSRPLAQVRHWKSEWAFAIAAVLLIVLTGIRLPAQSLRNDDKVTQYLDQMSTILEPNSLVFSSADAETFTLWYGTYATRQLSQAAPGLTLVNVALYQFAWYRRLLTELYPDLLGVGTTQVTDILAANQQYRPIYFTERIDTAPRDHLVPIGPIWRYQPTASE